MSYPPEIGIWLYRLPKELRETILELLVPYTGQSEDLRLFWVVLENTKEIAENDAIQDMRAMVAFWQGKYEKLTEITKKCPESEGVQLAMAQLLLRRGNFDLVYLTIEKSFHSEDPLYHIQSRVLLADLYRVTHEYNEAVIIIKNLEKWIKELDVEEEYKTLLWMEFLPSYKILSWVYRHQGDIIHAGIIAEYGTAKAKKHNHRLFTGIILNALGNVYKLSGEMSIAKLAFEQSFSYCTAAGDDRTGSAAIANLGNLLYYDGKFDESFAIFKDAYNLMDQIGDVRNIPIVLYQLSLAKRALGEYQEAWEYINESIEYMEEKGTREVYIYLDAAELAAIVNDNTKSTQYAKVGCELAKELNSVFYDIYCVISRGIIEINRLNFGNATELLTAGLNQADRNHLEDLSMKALFKLTEIKLKKYDQDSSQSNLIELEEMFDDLILLLKQYRVKFMTIDVAIIRASISAAKKDFRSSIKELTRVINHCKIERLEHHVEKATNKLKKVEYLQEITASSEIDEEELIHELLSEGIDDFSRLSDLKTSTSLLSDNKPAIPYVIMIIDSNRKVSYIRYIEEKYETDELLLTGFISAIHNLSFEIVDGRKNPLKSILHEEYAILLEHLVTEFMVAFIVNKETYETRRKVQMISEELNDITEWETDFDGMASAATKIKIDYIIQKHLSI
ncbi:MAG: tetratricopeptide repeat protein [Candidatus Kariarchaeaceae archaeon]